jgi:hypothetical protein
LDSVYSIFAFILTGSKPVDAGIQYGQHFRQQFVAAGYEMTKPDKINPCAISVSVSSDQDNPAHQQKHAAGPPHIQRVDRVTD